MVTKRKAIPLDTNEGIYARDVKSGKVRAICDSTYMLTQDEELWAKELPSGIEELLGEGMDPLADRVISPVSGSFEWQDSLQWFCH